VKLPYSISLAMPLIGLGSLAQAADMALKLDIPQLDVAAYHKPYVAVWLERADQTVVGNLAVLYDIKKKDNGGAKWLKDMRTWWRKAGRDAQMPMDGVSGATRAPGEAALELPAAKALLDKLPAGKYQVVIEAAREAGGRELVKVPFQWPAKAAVNATAKGKEELGKVALTIKP
jgi:hypothetical protein